MALSVPSPCSALDSNRAATTRSQQRVRKDERTWTTDTFAPYDDGHQWRKYGEKKLSNSKFPRFYYRCTYKNDMKCPATKQVQQKDSNDPPLFSVTYFNHHTCNSGDMRTVGAPEPAIQSSSRKAVSICFNSCAASDQNPFRSPSSTAAASPAVRSSETKQQLDRSTYTHHFQWASGVPSPRMAPVKMEVDDFAETSAPSGTGAPSRTLLPIGQSRCIEYFHFL